jgi:hypothetical protein
MFPKTFYRKNGFVAVLSEDLSCVVWKVEESSFRSLGAAASGDSVSIRHVGEKLPGQDWRGVRLPGCPKGVRQDIEEAYAAAIKKTRLSKVPRRAVFTGSVLFD